MWGLAREGRARPGAGQGLPDPTRVWQALASAVRGADSGPVRCGPDPGWLQLSRPWTPGRWSEEGMKVRKNAAGRHGTYVFLTTAGKHLTLEARASAYEPQPGPESQLHVLGQSPSCMLRLHTVPHVPRTAGGPPGPRLSKPRASQVSAWALRMLRPHSPSQRFLSGGDVGGAGRGGAGRAPGSPGGRRPREGP